MPIMMLPAHGALGAWDEAIFFVVLAAFVAMMIRSWLTETPAEEDEMPAVAVDAPPTADESRFELK